MWKPFQDRDPSEEELAAWDRITAPHNWALVLGRASGLVVIDKDPRNGGDESIKKYPMPLTFTIATPSGGHHYYFSCPVGGCASRLTFDQGLEIKGDGNIVLIPPSRKNGRPYEVVIDEPPIPLPEWAYAAPTKTKTSGASTWRDAFKAVPRGEQHTRLVSLCGLIARTFPEDHWPAIPEILWSLAKQYPQDPRNPWTQEDMQVIAESVCATEQRNRTQRIKVRVLG